MGRRPDLALRRNASQMSSVRSLKGPKPGWESEPRIDRTVTHGISCSIYFFDPEDNRVKLFYKTGYDVKQPFGQPIGLEDPTENILEFSKSFEATLGPPQGATR